MSSEAAFRLPPMRVPQVTGHTAVYFIIGDPITQVRAPETFNSLFAKLGIDAILVPLHVPAADLAVTVPVLLRLPNVRGLWVTIPHKTPMLQVIDHCSAVAQVAGAVNAVRRLADGSLEGDLFDGLGFLGGLNHDGIPCANKKVLILGAGGAAAAIATTLALHPTQACASLALFDPTPGKAAALAAQITAASACPVLVANSNDPKGFDLVINASPLGLHAGDPLPCDMARMESHAAFADILMKNQPTPGLRAAMARGLKAQAGFEMLIQQTALYLDFFGYPQAAAHVRADTDFLRDVIYPAELRPSARSA
jgi:shikimate dehydrogenase